MEKKEKEMDSTFSVKLPTRLLNKVREKSKETGVAISFVIRKALERWINEKK